MKSFVRLTNSYVMTATLLAVITGALCFSVGEGLHLRPFPTLSLIEDAGTVKDAGESLSKYGPLDVPAQVQKRNKRQAVEIATAGPARTRPAFAAVVHRFHYEAEHVRTLSFITPHSGRAPPLNT